MTSTTNLKCKNRETARDKINCMNYKNENISHKTLKLNKTELKTNYALSCSMNKKTSSWIIDSGASVHMCKDKSLFQKIENSTGTFRVANGNTIPIIGFGDVKLNMSSPSHPTFSLILKNVAYIPQLDVNLLSVRCLSNEYDNVIFNKNGCFIKLQSKALKIGTIERSQYFLNKTKENQQANLCVHDWHKRMAHRNLENIKRLKHIGLKISPCKCSNDCESCIKGKLATSPFPKVSEKPSEVLELIVSDVCGPIGPISLGRAQYFLTIIDVHSDYTEIFMINKKSDAKVHIMNYITKMENILKMKPKVFRSDRGGEYIDHDLQEFFAKKGVQFQCTVHDSPQQNGIAERKNRTLVEAIRSMLYQNNLQKNLWGEALNNAVYTFNRIPKANCNLSPIEIFYNKSVSKTFKEFGCKVFYSTNPNGRKKLDAKASEGKFMGVDNASKGFRIFTGNKIRIERNVRFMDKSEMVPPNNETEIENVNSQSIMPDESSQNIEPRRSPRLILKYQANLASDDPMYEPTTYKQAINCINKNMWIIAIEEELNSIRENKTWSLVDLPPGCNTVGSRWVFGLKRNAEGEVVRYKARLVAKGFTQKFGVDYDEVFAPVARSATFRILLTISSARKLVVQQFDVKTAFLNGVLEEEIYMKPPPGSVNVEDSDKVFKLHKSLYGLKQAARSWNKTLHDALMKTGFRQSINDNCLYVLKNDNEECYVITHVDDMLLAAKTKTVIDKVSKSLNCYFEMKSLGDVKQFLGIQVSKYKDGSYMINQSSYISKIAKEFKLEDCKNSKYPLHPGYHKFVDGKELDTNNDYRKLIGMLLYISTNTRPDVSAAVSILAQRVAKPRDVDLIEALRVVRYLVTTKNHTLKLFNPQSTISLEAFSDSDFAEDKKDRKSLSGFLCSVLGAPVSWSSRKQNIVSTSTTEAEFYALAEATKELLWLKELLTDFEVQAPDPIPINSDNKSTIAMIENDKFSSRTKHIDVRLHFVRELVYNKRIKLKYIPTTINPADMFTKPLPGVSIERLRELSQISDYGEGCRPTESVP